MGEGTAHHERIDLRPLTKRQSRQLVEEILRQSESVPEVLREVVVGSAEGNPFYVEELIKMLIDQGVIQPDPERWHIDARRLVEVRVPPTLTGIIQARLDRLTRWERVVSSEPRSSGASSGAKRSSEWEKSRGSR